MVALHESDYARWPSNAAIYLPGGRPPRAGELFVQADLAATLGFMVEEERAHLTGGRAAGLAAARDAFYKGDIATTIAAFHHENDGWLTRQDMSDFRVAIDLSCAPASRTGRSLHAARGARDRRLYKPSICSTPPSWRHSATTRSTMCTS